MSMHVYAMACMWSEGNLEESVLFLVYWFLGWNSGHQDYQQVPLSAEPPTFGFSFQSEDLSPFSYIHISM